MCAEEKKQGLAFAERNKWHGLNGGICGICDIPDLNTVIEMVIKNLIAMN
jgi:hypothetical protein